VVPWFRQLLVPVSSFPFVVYTFAFTDLRSFRFAVYHVCSGLRWLFGLIGSSRFGWLLVHGLPLDYGLGSSVLVWLPVSLLVGLGWVLICCLCSVGSLLIYSRLFVCWLRYGLGWFPCLAGLLFHCPVPLRLGSIVCFGSGSLRVGCVTVVAFVWFTLHVAVYVITVRCSGSLVLYSGCSTVRWLGV
jgi:hypothetical protein